ARQSVYQLLITHHKAHAPSGHVIALAHGEELDRNIAGALNLQDGGRDVTIESDVGVGQIMHDENIVLACQFNDALKERNIYTLGRRIAGESQYHHLWAGNRLAYRAFDFLKKVQAWHNRDRADIRAGDHSAINMDGITWIWHQHGITPVKGGQHQVRQT